MTSIDNNFNDTEGTNFLLMINSKKITPAIRNSLLTFGKGWSPLSVMYDIISMGDGQLLQTINRLAEELSSSECRRLAYLCESPGSVSSGPDVREMLRARLSQGEVNHLYLVELMFRLGRFDLLRKVLLVDKQDVERILGHLKGVSEYRLEIFTCNLKQMQGTIFVMVLFRRHSFSIFNFFSLFLCLSLYPRYLMDDLSEDMGSEDLQADRKSTRLNSSHL